MSRIKLTYANYSAILRQTKEVLTVEISQFFPMWNSLNDSQRSRLSAAAAARQVKKGTVLHNGSMDCCKW